MCGFSGIFRWDSQPADKALLRRMTGQIVHRGPDDEGFFFTEPGQAVQAGLGFRRLSIIDLSGGHQPMSSADGKCWIVFNGEIYNFLELRKDLETRGRKLATKSDTEVILHLYDLHGAECVKYLRGMFAFAIWDARKQQIFMARDRAGKKPLYYARTNKAVYFASEMKSILCVPEIKPDVRLESIPLSLTYQFIPGPETIFSNITRLPPAHTLTCDGKGNMQSDRYWTLPRLPRLTGSVNEIKEQVRETLREATRIRLISDVPLGAFLSGGIDSSAVVGLMAQEMSQPVKTFSIGFEEQDFSELKFARMTAERFRTDHNEFIVKPETASILPKLAWHYDQPFADPSALPSYYVARETRKHVTVALNGDGGDESFGGYLRYQADRIFSMVSSVPRGLRSALARAARSGILPRSSHFARRIARAASILDSTPQEFNFRLFCYFDQETLNPLLGERMKPTIAQGNVSDYFEGLYSQSDSEEFLDQVFDCDTHGYLPECLLVKMDVATMANSLESRSPFLDHKVMELAARIPPSLKVHVNGGKWILKEAMKGFIPDEILYRRKMGFGVPLSQWFKTSLKDFLRDTLLSRRAAERGYFSHKEVERLVNEHQNNIKDHGYKLWALMMFELWNNVYVDKLHNFSGEQS